MSDIDVARLLLSKANHDLSALRGMMDKTVFVEDIFGFHAQQAIEKSLKAWLSLIGVAFPKIHDLEELFALLKEQNQIIPGAFHSLVDFTDFAVQFRYDAFESFEDGLNRDDVIKRVQGFVNHVEMLLQNISTKEEDSEEPS